MGNELSWVTAHFLRYHFGSSIRSAANRTAQQVAPAIHVSGAITKSLVLAMLYIEVSWFMAGKKRQEKLFHRTAAPVARNHELICVLLNKLLQSPRYLSPTHPFPWHVSPCGYYDQNRRHKRSLCFNLNCKRGWDLTIAHIAAKQARWERDRQYAGNLSWRRTEWPL